MQQMEQAFAAAAAMGVTVTVAAGDNGSGDGVNDGLAHVDFPASAPHALACGGTSLQLSTPARSLPKRRGTTGPGAAREEAASALCSPSPRTSRTPISLNRPTRVAKPAVACRIFAGDADPDTGYTVRVDGETMTVGGTSAVAPLWAGLIALLNQSLGQPVGFLQPFLYSAAGMASLHEITSGSNGAYSAHAGWNACTGLGSPDGRTC